MNSDSEASFSQLFAWLLQDPASTTAQSPQECEESNNGVENHSPRSAAPSGTEESGWTPQTSLELGEIPAVQDRFQAVLKRRLQIEIEKRPPLFPWETELLDYPDFVERSSWDLVPEPVWMAQQDNLSLPIRLPDSIFQQLLDRCQELVKSSLPPGPKLIQAVEDLFPNESQTLNQLARLVLTTPVRSRVEDMPSLSDYAELMPPQQMVLSLLAAQQLLETLTLSVTPTDAVVERQWLTSAGTLTLHVNYQSQSTPPKLRVEGDLPTSGVIKLQGERAEAMAQCSTSGRLSVELCGVELNQTYALEIQFPEFDLQPLMFAISVTL